MKHEFSRHQILNITTGFLHTSMDDIYDFFGKVIEPGIMTHMLPNAGRAIIPILQSKLPDAFFIREYQPNVPNDPVVFEFTEDDKKAFWENSKAYNGHSI